MNENSKRMEYDGKVFNTAMAMADLTHGGQIILDGSTFDGIKFSLAHLRTRVAAQPRLQDLEPLCGCALFVCTLSDKQLRQSLGQALTHASSPCAWQ